MTDGPKHVGRPLTIGGVKVAATLGRKHLDYLTTIDANRSAAIRRVIEEHQQRADKNRGVSMASNLATRVAETDGRVYRWSAAAHDVIPRRYTLTWNVRYITEESGSVYTMSADVDYTYDEISGAANVPDNVIKANATQLAAMLQENIKRWQWEEATAGLRIASTR